MSWDVMESDLAKLTFQHGENTFLVSSIHKELRCPLTLTSKTAQKLLNLTVQRESDLPVQEKDKNKYVTLQPDDVYMARLSERSQIGHSYIAQANDRLLSKYPGVSLAPIVVVTHDVGAVPITNSSTRPIRIPTAPQPWYLIEKNPVSDGQIMDLNPRKNCDLRKALSKLTDNSIIALVALVDLTGKINGPRHKMDAKYKNEETNRPIDDTQLKSMKLFWYMYENVIFTI